MALALVTQLLLLIEEPSSISDVLFNETALDLNVILIQQVFLFVALLFRSFHYDYCFSDVKAEVLISPVNPNFMEGDIIQWSSSNSLSLSLCMVLATFVLP